ncbi:hypothetical protein SAMN04487759_10125 [Kandleria vitulina]|uniref:Uncharacterized protein n=1 Tax=Kandleria vitulina TaxID=1630 RepID=A0A1H2PWI7_9FIRM|nr:hypothetical protein [Kandleria vitulina]SDV99221.1 hypothetical protein SAMN04487759_10125 [Kandleria vitulina]
MQYMYKVLNTSDIPDDSDIAIEYRIPNTNRRVDFIVAGEDETFASDHNILSFELDPRARTKKYVRDQIDNIGLSLHDSRVKKIEVNDDTLILIVDGIYQYQDEEETTSSGVVEFTKVDLEYFEIMVFDYPFGYDDNGSFTGRCYSLEELSKCGI